MEYQVVIEHDSATGHYTATVPGMPEVTVDAKTERSALKLAREAILLAAEERRPGGTAKGRMPRSHVHAKVVTVTL